jgi:hypothetical protein
MKSLDALALERNTDKGSRTHNYCTKYEKYLPFKRDSYIRILEIGVAAGGSLDMWAAYYPNAIWVVGMDINPDCKKFENPEQKIFIEIGSQTDESRLLKIISDYGGGFDLIIDDGSHQQDDMLQTFKVLFRYLNPQGVYILEDTCCAYWPEYGGGLHNKNSIIEHLKLLVDDVNFLGQKLKNHQPNLRREDLHIEQVKNENLEIRTDIESINFLNSTVLVTKR